MDKPKRIFWILYGIIICFTFGFILTFNAILALISSLGEFVFFLFAVFGEVNERFKWSKKKWLILILLPLLLSIILVPTLGDITVSVTVETTEYDIYHVDAPFGVLWRDVSGSFVLASGHLDTTLRETYIVKYIIGNQLHTKQFDAVSNYIVVDGKFCLEQIVTTEITIYKSPLTFLGEFRYKCKPEITFQIHLPGLPPVNGTTIQYEIVG